MIVNNEDHICTIIPEMKQIDVNNSSQFSRDLKEIIKNENKTFILDLQNIAFIDSSGLGAIVSILRELNESGRKLVLCDAAPAVEVLFNMVRLSQIADICKSRDDALLKLKI